MERVNRRGRSDPLRPGEPIVVYVPSYVTTPGTTSATASNGPASNGPLPLPPLPDLSP
jgi:transcription elongation factor